MVMVQAAAVHVIAYNFAPGRYFEARQAVNMAEAQGHAGGCDRHPGCTDQHIPSPHWPGLPRRSAGASSQEVIP